MGTYLSIAGLVSPCEGNVQDTNFVQMTIPAWSLWLTVTTVAIIAFDLLNDFNTSTCKIIALVIKG